MDTQDRLGKDRLGKNNNILSTSVDCVNGSKYTVRLARLYDKCVYKRLYAFIVRGWVSLLQVKKLQLECKK